MNIIVFWYNYCATSTSQSNLSYVLRISSSLYIEHIQTGWHSLNVTHIDGTESYIGRQLYL